MKYIFLSVVIVVVAQLAHGGAIGSVYNGEQFKIQGQLLVQDADKPNSFYFLPRKYKLKTKSRINVKSDKIEKTYGLHHQVVSEAGHQYSVYTMKLTLDRPGQLRSLDAELELRRLKGNDAKILGLTPVCGLRLDLPTGGVLVSNTNSNPVNPDAIQIKYSLSSTEAGRCTSILDTSDVVLEYRVPMAREPEVANKLVSSVGLVLPSVELVLPYKYKDRVVVSVDAEMAYEQTKTAGSLTGDAKSVMLEARASVDAMFGRASATGKTIIDCQNPDRTICDRFVEQAKDHLVKMLFVFTPIAEAQAPQVLVGDKEKIFEAGKTKVGLAFDAQTAKRQQNFVIDFSNAVYSSISAQAQVEINKIPFEIFDPAVQALVKSKANSIEDF